MLSARGHYRFSSSLFQAVSQQPQLVVYANPLLKAAVAASSRFSTTTANNAGQQLAPDASPVQAQKAAAIANSPSPAPHFKKDLAPHPLERASAATPQSLHDEAVHSLPHPIWNEEAVHSVEITHFKPQKMVDRAAYCSVQGMRFLFDVFSGYKFGRIDERGWLNRIVFLETVAGVPGMVGAMVRHLNSLRRMERDYGWIHTLLEEAENERMHLMTAMVLKKPGPLFRFGVLATQGIFLSMFSVSYLISPRFAHRFVGYLEEEAVKTYTHLLVEMDKGNLPLFQHLPAPPVSRDYWALPRDAMLRDVVLAIRADESHHRDVNHTFAGMQHNSPNPFPPGH